jgi:hypothetical protein
MFLDPATRGNELMRGQRNTRTSFRPQLESLESREVLSTASPLGGSAAAALGSLLTGLQSGSTGQSSSGKQLTSQQSLALQILITYPSTGTSTGFMLDTLTPGTAFQAHNMIAQVNQLSLDQQLLTNDINGGASSSKIAADYSRASSLYNQIKTETTTIQSQAAAEQYILQAAQQSGTLNPTDLLQVTYALNQANRAVQVANFEIGQANNVATAQEPNGNLSIASHG